MYVYMCVYVYQFCPIVDGVVPHTQDMNLRIGSQHKCSTIRFS